MSKERLTPYEREFAEKNHNVIYAYLHDRKLNVEEYYEVVLLDYIRAVRRYNREKRLQKYSFCTMAWKCMDTACGNYWRKKRRKHDHEIMSLDAGYQENVESLHDAFEDKSWDNVWDEIETLDCIKGIVMRLTDTQIRQLELLYVGYNCREVAEILGVNEHKERDSRKAIRKIAEDIL